MLNLYFKDDERDRSKIPYNIVTDVELEFSRLNIPDTELVRVFISCIDHGEYLSSTHFTDRFGSKLSLDYLSTGCKAAILVALEPDTFIDIRECGNKARDSILRHCKDGNIVLIDNGSDYTLTENDDIDICIGKYRFTNGDRLCTYMRNEKGFEKYMDMSDVELA